MELLARFELATSSLPMGLCLCYIVLWCCKRCCGSRTFCCFDAVSWRVFTNRFVIWVAKRSPKFNLANFKEQLLTFTKDNARMDKNKYLAHTLECLSLSACAVCYCTVTLCTLFEAPTYTVRARVSLLHGVRIN